MTVRFWGVRGSIPTPVSNEEMEAKLVCALQGAGGVDLTDQAAVRRYVQSLPQHIRGTWGGNTTCIQAVTEQGDMLIIDAGTGVRELGQSMLSTEFGRGEGYAVMLFTHTHWDHIQGLPFFAPLFIPGNQFDLLGRHDGLEERLRYQMEPRFFPVGMEVMGARMQFGQLPDTMELFDGRVRVSSLALDHPGTSYAYRVEADGHSFVMATDGEYKELTGPYWQRYVDFYHDADVLIFDAQYTLREALFEKQNWGHSSAMIGIDLAAEAGVGTIVMVHHEPSYPDEKVRGIFEDALRYVDRTPSANRPEVAVAYEGLVLDL